jgi:hypothetical protein
MMRFEMQKSSGFILLQVHQIFIFLGNSAMNAMENHLKKKEVQLLKCPVTQLLMQELLQMTSSFQQKMPAEQM